MTSKQATKNSFTPLPIESHLALRDFNSSSRNKEQHTNETKTIFTVICLYQAVLRTLLKYLTENNQKYHKKTLLFYGSNISKC